MACCRLVKEVASYEKEAKDNEAKVNKMREDGKDPYDIRKQEEVSPVLARGNTRVTRPAALRPGSPSGPALFLLTRGPLLQLGCLSLASTRIG